MHKENIGATVHLNYSGSGTRGKEKKEGKAGSIPAILLTFFPFFCPGKKEKRREERPRAGRKRDNRVMQTDTTQLVTSFNPLTIDHAEIRKEGRKRRRVPFKEGTGAGNLAPSAIFHGKKRRKGKKKKSNRMKRRRILRDS